MRRFAALILSFLKRCTNLNYRPRQGVAPNLIEEADALLEPYDSLDLDSDDWLCVDLTELSPERARVLTASREPVYLDSVRELSAEAAKALVNCEWLSLGGLTTLSDEVAEILAEHKGTCLFLRGLTSLSDQAAASLRRNGNITLPEKFRQ